MILNKLGLELSGYILQELNKKENIEKIKKKVINPLIDYTYHRLYPYILITSIIFFLTFMFALIILFLIVKS